MHEIKIPYSFHLFCEPTKNVMAPKMYFWFYFIHKNKIYEQNNNMNSRTDYTYFQPSKYKICWGFQTLQCFTLIRNFYFLLGKFFISLYSHVAHSLTVTAYTRYLYKNVFDFFLSYFSISFFSKLFIIHTQTTSYIIICCTRLRHVYLFFIFHRILSDTPDSKRWIHWTPKQNS